MLTTHRIVVTCQLDGKQKDFFYTLTPDKRLGLRYGCSDKRICGPCRECWLRVREILKKDAPQHDR